MQIQTQRSEVDDQIQAGAENRGWIFSLSPSHYSFDLVTTWLLPPVSSTTIQPVGRSPTGRLDIHTYMKSNTLTKCQIKGCWTFHLSSGELTGLSNFSETSLKCSRKTSINTIQMTYYAIYNYAEAFQHFPYTLLPTCSKEKHVPVLRRFEHPSWFFAWCQQPHHKTHHIQNIVWI